MSLDLGSNFQRLILLISVTLQLLQNMLLSKKVCWHDAANLPYTRSQIDKQDNGFQSWQQWSRVGSSSGCKGHRAEVQAHPILTTLSALLPTGHAGRGKAGQLQQGAM